jgi:transcriptional regulator with XRE-family HTH domain
MSIGIRHSITSGQCRAARALLDITQPELAEAAGLGLSTIVDFEKSRRDVSRAAVHAIQKALEKAATTFKQKYYETHGKNPSQAEIDAFVNGILPQEDEETP